MIENMIEDHLEASECPAAKRLRPEDAPLVPETSLVRKVA
jgi:hypothetical protein